MTVPARVPAVAVIGAGPRGTSVLERLVANHPELGSGPLVVHLVDPAPAGGGRVWRHDQPEHLMMNTLCADATHFTDDTVQCAGPIVPGPTLYDWCRMIVAGEVEWPDPVIATEAHRVQPHSHPSRRLLGSYLRWCYLTDCERLPAGMEVREHATRATGLTAAADGQLTVALAGGDALHVDAAVLATGHADTAPVGADLARVQHAERTGAWYGRPANPLDQDLSGIEAGETLIMRGLGMNFFDYVSMLTVGRGGSFGTEDGRLRYRPSGAEPVLAIGSGRGTPYRAKGVFGRMTPHFPPHFLTREVIDHLDVRRGIDFRTDLWPLIIKDTAWVYYSVLHEHRPEAFAGDVADILTGLAQFDHDDPALQQIIEQVVPEERDRADHHRWDRPLDGAQFESADAFRSWWLADLSHDLAEAEQGLASAYKCASVALGQGRGALRRLIRYGGLHGRSYDQDVDRWYRGFGGSLASGPPATRIAELIALTEAGLVQPIGPSMRITDVEDGFAASSPQVGGSTVTARALLEAHLPPASLGETADPLLAHLRDHGRARRYRIPGPDGKDFLSGALEVGPPPYRIKDVDGNEQPRLFAVGVPLESLHFGTQLGPLARTNSQFLRDSDAVARAMLARTDTEPGVPADAWVGSVVDRDVAK